MYKYKLEHNLTKCRVILDKKLKKVYTSSMLKITCPSMLKQHYAISNGWTSARPLFEDRIGVLA